MSRYRATTGELLEQVRKEAKTKDIYHMAFAGDNVEAISKKLKLDVSTVKKILGERFSMSDFKANEKQNHHSENAFELAKQFGTGKEIHDMKAIIKFVNQRGYINKQMFDIGVRITKKYASKLEAYREVQEEILNEYNPNFGKDTSAGRTKETHADNKKTQGEDRVKSLENEIQRLKLELENEKNATVKPEPNPDTGEVPLTIGIAHKYIKDKADKKADKKEEVEDNIQEARLPSFKDLVKYKYADDHAGAIHFSKIDGKEYHWNYLDRKGGQYSISTKKTGEIRVSRAGADSKINKVVKEEIELTEYFATVHSDKKPIVDFVKKYARTPSTQASIDYVDDDAGGNIEFEGKGAHDLADKVKAKFGVRVTKESFEPIENKSLEEMSLSSAERARGSDRPITIQYTYMRNPILFMQTLKGTKTGKKLKHVFPRKMGSDEYILKGTYQDHIDFLKTLNSKGIMPNNKIIGEELEEDTNKYITEKIKGLENKAKKTGMPYGILKKVYDRGMAAWKGGHRPGAGQQQWAFARVNSFVTKSSGTWGKADKDLAQKVRASESVEESTKVEGGPPTDGGPGSGAHNHDNKPSSKFDKVSNVKSFGKNLKGVTNVRQDGNRLEFDSNDGTATAREILKKFGKGKVKVTSILDDDDPEMKATVVVTPVKESRQLKDKETEMMVVKNDKVIVIDKSDFDKYKSKGYIQAEDKEEENEACWDSHKQVGTKMKGGKRVPNCVPKNEEIDLDEKAKELYMFSTKKDAEKKAKEIGGKVVTGTGKSKGYFAAMKEELELEANFSPDMINKMKKAYEPLRGKRIAPEPLMKIFDKIDKNKNALIQLFKADIPFVSQLAVSRLISKHNMKGAEINKLREEVEEVQEYIYADMKGKERTYTAIHLKHGKAIIKTSKGTYDAAKKYAQMKGLKSTAGVDVHLMEEEEVDEGYTPLGSGKLTPAQKRFQDVLKRATKDKESKKAAYLKTKEEVQEADLTDKQVDMVKKVADKLPKDDFKKRYGKDADNVKFGTATNIVKKKLNIDGYDGARNLVDRLLNKEKGDE